MKDDNSSKELYRVVNKLLDNTKEVVLPKSSTDVDLANDFSKYFSEKVRKIRESIKPSATSFAGTPFPKGAPQLSEFAPSTDEEIRKIISSHGVKCSPEDPVPVLLLKNNIEIFIPYWREIVNLSLEVGSMVSLKSAVIFPLIKELSALVDTDAYKNYRPVSNLVFISKLSG